MMNGRCLMKESCHGETSDFIVHHPVLLKECFRSKSVNSKKFKCKTSKERQSTNSSREGKGESHAGGEMGESHGAVEKLRNTVLSEARTIFAAVTQDG